MAPTISEGAAQRICDRIVTQITLVLNVPDAEATFGIFNLRENPNSPLRTFHLGVSQTRVFLSCKKKSVSVWCLTCFPTQRNILETIIQQYVAPYLQKGFTTELLEANNKAEQYAEDWGFVYSYKSDDD